MFASLLPGTALVTAMDFPGESSTVLGKEIPCEEPLKDQDRYG